MKNTDNKNKTLIGGTLLAGSIIGLGGIQAHATELFTCDDLGSGAELRAELVKSERTLSHSLELKCGEKGAKKEGKASEAKCGENKAEAKEEAPAEGKVKEAKCGEEGKKAKEESKSTEHKCGEGKCGEAKCGGAE